MQLRSDFQGRLINEVLCTLVTAEQRFDLAAQRIISGAGIGEKGRALVLRAFQCRVIERFDLLPALLVHLHFKEAPTRRESDFFFLASRRICWTLLLASQVGL